jgi:hypothetical protein
LIVDEIRLEPIFFVILQDGRKVERRNGEEKAHMSIRLSVWMNDSFSRRRFAKNQGWTHYNYGRASCTGGSKHAVTGNFMGLKTQNGGPVTARTFLRRISATRNQGN